MPEAHHNNPLRLLRVLMHLRSIAILCQLAVIGFAVGWLHMQLPLWWMLGFVAVLAAWNLFSLWRLHWAKPVSNPEISLHLLLDSAVLTGLLYCAGGPTNPFVSLYLVPIAIGAIALPGLQAGGLAVACVLAYSALFYWHQPLPHSHVGSAFDLHVIGMWANFILSAGLIAAFISLLARAVRQRDAALANEREQGMRNEQILALATQAAGAAHELNTPLSTLTVLVNELRQDSTTPASLQKDFDLMQQQLGLCQQRLRDLVEQSRHNPPTAVQLATLVAQLQARWSLLRPETHLQIDNRAADASILGDNSLPQAILNLMGNAADASADNGANQIRLYVSVSNAGVRIEIDDWGKGVGSKQNKTGGLGVGLSISNASIERLGGRVSLEDRPDGGARATVELPLVNQ
ncbi:MAG: ATP-binding protein [Nevskiales bacterium]